MDDVIYLDGAATREARAAPSLRQPGEKSPASQFVRIGAVVINLVARLEAQMNEGAITKP